MAPPMLVYAKRLAAVAFLLWGGSAMAACDPPTNWPTGVSATCQCDNFSRASLNPSTIYGGNWLITSSDSTGILPRIANSGFLRLTDKTGYNAKAASVPGVFPGAGNYISVEFNHYAYSGSGADGLAVILSDYSVPPQPGASGGSLGYAQKTGVDGFAGGWVGIALDEFGNFQNSGEGRQGGYPSNTRVPQSVGVRGSGSKTTGYYWLGGTPTLTAAQGIIDNSGSTTPKPGYMYQVVVDAREYSSSNRKALFSVNRDKTGLGASYSNLFASFDVYAQAASLGRTQANLPDNWQVSFTAGTGGSTNIHEIGNLKICAQTFLSSTTPVVVGGFNAIDSTYAKGDVNALSGHLFTRLTGTAFALNVAALKSSGAGIEPNFVIAGTKNVTVQLIDDNDALGQSCGISASACTSCSKPVIATQTMSFAVADKGFKKSGNFTVNTPYKKVLVRMTDGTATGCSGDQFAIRPGSVSSISSSANNSQLTGTPKFKAGTDLFQLTATTGVSGYNGVFKIDSTKIQGVPTGLVAGLVTPSSFDAALSGTSSSVATLNGTYSEVGGFKILAGGIYDDTWTAVDQGTKNDCVASSTSTTLDANGKYGCLIATTVDSGTIGRFVPSQYVLASATVTPFCSSVSPFTYMGQPFTNLSARVEARNGAGGVTQNYDSALLSNMATLTWSAENADNGVDLYSRLTIPAPSKTWANGVYLLNTGAALLARSTLPDNLESLQLGVKVNDTDGGGAIAPADINPSTSGSCTGGGCTAKAVGLPQALRFGRLKLSNVWGSEKTPLQMPVQAEYWTGRSWVLNLDDSCSVLAASRVALSGYQSSTGGGASWTTSVTGSPTLSGGMGLLNLSSPSPLTAGSVNLALNLGQGTSDQSCLTAHPSMTAPATDLSWLRGKNGSCTASNTYASDPSALATFGVFSAEKRKAVHVRELY